ncbi:hypothetical protein HDV64DRAFT_260194 [Trichoderma sp. TUCIM 5745]
MTAADTAPSRARQKTCTNILRHIVKIAVSQYHVLAAIGPCPLSSPLLCLPACSDYPRLRALAVAGVPPPTNASCEWRTAVHLLSLFSLMGQSHSLPPTLFAPVAVCFAPLRAIQRIRGPLHLGA